MIDGKKVVVVMPAYNAGRTLEATYKEIDRKLVDEVILVDDHSQDNTLQLASELGIEHVLQHNTNKGYGGNQKTCYDKALSIGAEIVVMLHPDYQYTPKLIPAMVSLIAHNTYPAVLGSRILGKGALRGGMPLYKYIANRILTLVQNILIGQKLSEYHSGYRAFKREVLENIAYRSNSDDFVFDNELLSQVFMAGYDIAEITCPTRYFKEASSINLWRSWQYGLGVLRVSIQHRLALWGLYRHKRYGQASARA